MTIQRQYSLPNCKLIVDGLSDDTRATGATRPPVSMLVNAECHFIGLNQSLSGGREFLESLVKAVSGYAQEFLSRVPHHKSRSASHEMIQLQRLGPDEHRLTQYPPTDSNHHAPVDKAGVVQIDLKTVQLFDLVDAVDQFLADTQTIPDLTLTVAPVSRRYAIAQESTAKRVAPAAAGVASLAAAALALFYLPTPEVRRTEPPAPAQSSPEAVVSPSPAASPVVDSTPSASPSELAESPSSSPDEVAASAPASPGSTATPDLDAVIGSATEVTDFEQLETLNRELRDKLSQAWGRNPEPEENTIYRVVVAENGDVVGFKQTDDDAIAYTDSTPLTNLLKLPAGETTNQTIAQFKVVFTPEGVVEVNPWRGWPKERAQEED